jgi:short-subunit dehydrogenase
MGVSMSVSKLKVLVTGATSGIGLETAILLAENGYEVIATGRTEEKTNQIHRRAEKSHVTIQTAYVDVANAESVANLKNDVLALTDGYGIDILVNNAGYAEGGAIEELSVSRLRSQFETNVFGLVAVSQEFIPFMRAHHHGKIINISSVLGKVSIPLMGAYTATKHAVEALSAAMRLELHDSGIQVVIVAPGSIQTNFDATLVEGFSTVTQSRSGETYHAAYEKFKRDRNTAKGANPQIIARTILKIAESGHPKARYAVPFDSKAFPILKAILPTKVLDRLLIKFVMGK